jgi:tetratricopeptide (TPR) repeat protein
VSLLRDALGTGTDAKAEHDKEKPDSLSFSGAVLDADELLGGVSPDREKTLSEPAREVDSSRKETLPVDDIPEQVSLQGAAFSDELSQSDAAATAQVTVQSSEAPLQQSSARQVPPAHPPEPAYSKSAADETSVQEPALATGAVPRRFVNPDPLFFIIIAFACVALFGSVYALVTQNDEYVSREYAELRARQNSLEALVAEQQQQLAQSAVATGPGDASESADVTGDGIGVTAAAEQIAPAHAVQQEAAQQKAVQQEAVQQQPSQQQPAQQQITAAPVSTQPDARTQTATTLETVPVEPAATEASATSVSVPVTNTSTEAPVSRDQSVVPDQASASDQQLVLLQQELSALRETIAGQNKKISQLLAARTPQQNDEASQPSATEASSGSNLSGSKPSTPVTPAQVDTSAPVYDKAGNVTITSEQTAMVVGDDRSPEIRLPAQGDAGYAEGGFSALIGQAFHAYSTGNMALAGTLYRRAVQLEPYNRDANLGVAAVATDAGEFAEATQRYRHLLSLNPGDEVAFSGMLNLVAATGNRAIENEMIVHASQYQQMPVLHAALGNYYSRQSRWSEASNSYATATALAPDTADYLYNLAVSLDQLGNTGAAIENYERAMAMSKRGHHSFDSITVNNRLQSLKQP